MKEIKELYITVTYLVALKNTSVSDSVHEGLEKISNELGFTDDDAQLTTDQNIIDAYEWLGENVKHSDAWYSQFEVEITD